MREGYRKEQKKTMKPNAVKEQEIEVEKQQLTGEHYRFPIIMSRLFFGCGLYSLQEQCTYIRSKGQVVKLKKSQSYYFLFPS